MSCGKGVQRQYHFDSEKAAEFAAEQKAAIEKCNAQIAAELEAKRKEDEARKAEQAQRLAAQMAAAQRAQEGQEKHEAADDEATLRRLQINEYQRRIERRQYSRSQRLGGG
jgi:hypothetical protein